MLKAKKIADISILLALGIVANIVSFPVMGSFGRFSLVYFVAYIAGIFFGPYIGMGVTMLSDLIPAFLLPQGPWMPFITLGTGCISLIVGLVNRYLPFKFHWRLIIGAIIAYALCTCGIIAFGETPLFYQFPYTLAKSLGAALDIKSPFLMLSLAKMITQPIWITANVIITGGVCVKLRNIIDRRYGGVIVKPSELKNTPETVILAE